MESKHVRFERQMLNDSGWCWWYSCTFWWLLILRAVCGQIRKKKKKLQQPNLDEYSETKICSAIRLDANLGTTSSRADMKSQLRLKGKKIVILLSTYHVWNIMCYFTPDLSPVICRRHCTEAIIYRKQPTTSKHANKHTTSSGLRIRGKHDVQIHVSEN